MTDSDWRSIDTTDGSRGFFQTACSQDICVAPIKVAPVVCSLLNRVNKGTRLWNAEPINWFTFYLNFVVPYCVASYSAATNELRHRPRESTH